MDNTKNDSYYVEKIVEDVAFIIKYTSDISLGAFKENELLQDSMMFRLIQISEAVVKLSDEFKEANQSIPWFAIKGLRNRIVHDYGNVDLMTIVYETIKVDIPEVSESLRSICE